ncbi:ABC transporter permease subunit [Natrinema salifodinae]|uniref:ABC-2 type transport system permease protein n=1 Tax=Natrinema salifodinae TaxID=1202768 RepID=A0A1I0PER2_9EURY|nr:ABC transporter permease subunit [Natrinema salifodinae]SEW12881.1 ABC-2 type transport system permease protein [Natrinema salifodinae]
MNWKLIARKEVGDAIRNRQLYAIAATFALVFSAMAALYVSQLEEGYITPGDLVSQFGLPGMLLVPVTGLLIAYGAIVRRRSNGQLTLLLGLPHDRRDIVLGMYVGRYVVFLASLFTGVITGVAVILATGHSVPTVDVLAYLLISAGLGLAYLAIAIGISAMVRTQTWASFAVFGALLLLLVVWRFVPDGLSYIAAGFEEPATQPWWTSYVSMLSPSLAYEQLLLAVLEVDYNRSLTGFSAAVLLGWAVLAPAVGYWRFATDDL